MMNEESFKLAERLVPKSYIELAQQARRSFEQEIRQILEHRKLPAKGLEEDLIEHWLKEISMMDSNNFQGNVGVGEREGRIFSALVARRNSSFSHGIGRSGDINAIQPKAAGSSLLCRLTNELVLDAVHQIGLRSIKSALVVPMATGMTMTLCLLTLKKERPQSRYVLWSRIDQKSCFKCILTANLEPIIIEQIENEGFLETDVAEFEKQIEKLEATNICCIISTTSCFAPRAVDKIEDLSRLCKKFEIPHLINNAYGLQSTKIIQQIEETLRSDGRVDLIVQSSDKNFLVPVGGGIVLTKNEEILEKVARNYPGRASMAAHQDLFITLLSMGKTTLVDLLRKRKEIFNDFYEKLQVWAKKNDEIVISSKKFSPISVAVSLNNLPVDRLTELGSMLFTRRISGARVVQLKTKQTIESFQFENFGSHSSKTKFPYLTVAAAIGMEPDEVDVFMKKFDSIYQQIRGQSKIEQKQ